MEQKKYVAIVKRIQMLIYGTKGFKLELDSFLNLFF